jgi:hypothetical protein
MAAGHPAPVAPDPPASFPSQDPTLVREMVGVSHGQVDRVRELVTEYPELAKANIDWGFGDWESALGAASHTGRREIALFLLDNGARPTLFSAAMLGQLAVVRAMVEAAPGIQGTPGPHGITLLSHARAGGEDAASVVAYLEEVGGADSRTVSRPLSDEERVRMLGTFRYGPVADETLEVTDRDGTPFIGRPGMPSRGMTHLGALEFTPAGAPSVRIRFEMEGAGLDRVRVVAGSLEVEARRT